MIYFDAAHTACLGTMIHNLLLRTDLITRALADFLLLSFVSLSTHIIYILNRSSMKLSTNLLEQCQVDLNSSRISLYYVRHK